MLNTEKKVVIVSATRTPFDKFGGDMKDVHSIELAKTVLENVVNKISFKKENVQEIVYGSTIHEEIGIHGNVPVRQALLKAGYPASTISYTVDRACCSSMAAFQYAYKDILFGDCDVAIAAGADNLSNSPYLLVGARWGKKMGSLELYDHMSDMAYHGWAPVSSDTDAVAKKYDITREMMDEWAYKTQQRYQAAHKRGFFKDEIIPYTVKLPKGKEVVISDDASPRPETTLEKLASLKTVYGTEAITAGNAPGLNAGASAILLMTEEKAMQCGLKPLAHIKDIASVADEAQNIPVVPALAIQKLLDNNEMTIKEIDRIEINEAFATMPLVSTKILANGDERELERLHDITNVNGGAIAIGHPMGPTGCRMIMTLMYELINQGGGIGIAALCGGLAQGDGVMIEVK